MVNDGPVAPATGAWFLRHWYATVASAVTATVKVAEPPCVVETGAGWRTIATTTGGPPAGVTERVTLELVTDPAGSVITTE